MKTKQVIATSLALLLFAGSCKKAARTLEAEQVTNQSGTISNNAIAAIGFVHPGGLHTQVDLNRMKAKIAAGAQPWKGSWDKLIAGPKAQLSYTPSPQSVICRGSYCSTLGLPQNYGNAHRDIAAAYQCGLRYHISGDVRYANKSIQILNAWSAALTEITGSTDQSLAAGTMGWQFAVVGEMMRGYSGWAAADQTRFKNMLLNVIYPDVKDFLVRHHGQCFNHYRGNWDATNVSALVAIGVFCDNPTIFSEGIDYYKGGIGTGDIHKLIWYIHPDGTGQPEEAGRDFPHTMGGLHWMSMATEIAWNQGVDLYGYDNSRFLKGLEYTTKYLLGTNVPYRSYTNCKNVVEATISPRVNLQPMMWDLLYNHYVRRKGMAAPYVTQAAAAVRPEGGPDNYGGAVNQHDHLGFGTLTFTRDAASAQSITNGTYKLFNRASGKMVDNLGSTVNGATVAQWQASTSNNQRWEITYGGGYYKIRCLTGGMFLDSGGGTTDGAQVKQYTSSTSTNQQWSITPAGTGFYKIINRATGKCLDTGGGTANGSVMQLWGSGNSENQLWSFGAP